MPIDFFEQGGVMAVLLFILWGYYSIDVGEMQGGGMGVVVCLTECGEGC